MAGTTFVIRSDDFAKLQRAMQNANRDFYNQFRRELRRTLNYARDDIREDDWDPVEDKLNSSWKNPPSPPISGGSRNIRSSVSYRTANIRATSAPNMRLLNAGMVRHPGPNVAMQTNDHGKGGHYPWFTTPAPTGVEGWWDRGVAKQLPFIVQQSQLTIDHYVQKIAADIGIS